MLVKETGLYFEGQDLLPFLKIGTILANFQSADVCTLFFQCLPVNTTSRQGGLATPARLGC